MKLFKRLTFMLFLLAVSARADERSEWFAERRAWIEQSKSAQTPESMLNLARIVTGVGRNLDQASPEAKDLFYQAKEQLLAIPGHAEFYRNRIIQAQEHLKNQVGEAPWSDYHKEIENGFQVFPHLHSPEGVRVLGELLSNAWVPPGNETAPLSGKFIPLSVSATVTLPKFPLLDKPFKDPITQENVGTAHADWQLWYEQIKSGKRTFRFEGDPTEYDLNGPAAGQKLAHISRDRKRDEERQAGRDRTTVSPAATTPATASKHSKSMPVALLIAGMVLLVSLGWYFLNRRKTA